MSSNTLVAFCVGCLFLLAVVVIVASFIERRRESQPLRVEESPTGEWPKHDGA